MVNSYCMNAIRIEISAPASLDRVWDAWTKSDQITKWFSPDARVNAKVGGPFELFFDPRDHGHQCTKGCVFTLIEPQKELRFTWKGPDQFAELMNKLASLTSVRVAFHSEKESTRVVVEHSGWGEGEDWVQARDWHQHAWEEALECLKAFLETGTSQL